METGGHEIDELFYGTVTVGERGQIVIPAQAREEHGISPGDKLLVFTDPHKVGITFVGVRNVGQVMERLERAIVLMREQLNKDEAGDE